MGGGFDIVSGGELHRVLMAGGDPTKVVFSGVGKTAAEMKMALNAGIHCFNVESESELELLNRVAGELRTRAPVSIRVNPDVDAKTHPYISTGLSENKFGVDINMAPDVYAHAAELPNIKVVGVDCHIGSQLTELSPYWDALDRVLKLVDKLESQGIGLAHIDLGGGLGVTYKDEVPPHPSELYQGLFERLGNRPQQLIFEPGRSIAANAGVLVTRVLVTKETPAKNFAVVDAAMNDMLRPALYQSWMNIEPVEQPSAEVKTWEIVGPICESADFLGKQRELALAEGDLLCLFSAGAYGFSMSSNYNSRPRAAEIMVSGDQSQLTRERESLDDLIVGEHRFRLQGS
jgi:diaminopimelate decarboxylase